MESEVRAERHWHMLKDLERESELERKQRAEQKAESDCLADRLRQKIRELSQQLQATMSQHDMELESARTEGQFKDTKLQAAEREAEQLRQEVQRLKAVEDDLNRRCRDNDETVQQVVANLELERRGFDQELQRLTTESEARAGIIAAKSRVMEQMSQQEMQLREAVGELNRRIDCCTAENASLAEANRRFDKQSLDQLEQRLKQTAEKLADSEQLALDLQSYSANLEAELDAKKQQLLDLRARLQEEQQRSACMDSELSRLKLDYSRLRVDYSQIERNAAQTVAREQELQTRLAQVQHRLGQAEEAIGYFKDNLRANQTELDALKPERDRLRSERDQWKMKVDRLIGFLTEQQTNLVVSTEASSRGRTSRQVSNGGNA